MSVALGAAEVLGAVVVFFCYLHIFLFVRNTRNNVRDRAQGVRTGLVPTHLKLILSAFLSFGWARDVRPKQD